jgi:hypothetical protein
MNIILKLKVVISVQLITACRATLYVVVSYSIFGV